MRVRRVRLCWGVWAVAHAVLSVSSGAETLEGVSRVRLGSQLRCKTWKDMKADTASALRQACQSISKASSTRGAVGAASLALKMSAQSRTGVHQHPKIAHLPASRHSAAGWTRQDQGRDTADAATGHRGQSHCAAAGRWGTAGRAGWGACSRRRDCHSAAPPSPFSGRFNVDGEGVSAK